MQHAALHTSDDYVKCSRMETGVGMYQESRVLAKSLIILTAADETKNAGLPVTTYIHRLSEVSSP